MPTETPAEAPKTSPETPRDVIQQVNGFLERLKTDVAKEANPDKKKEIVAKSYKSLNQLEREELSKRVEEHKEGIPHELLEDLIGVLDVTDERKAALKAAIESGSDKKKPEGWMAWAGDQMKSGADKVGQWTDWLLGKTKSGVGFGWDKTVEGLAATGEWIMKIWGKFESSFNAARAGIAVALGGLVAKMDKILPAWLKDGFNTLVGNYGVFYATLNRLGVKIAAGAAQLAQGASEQVNASVGHFSEIYEQAKAWGNTTLDFPGFIREVASRLRKVQPSLTFTMADMVAMAGIVAGEKNVAPAVPTATPAPAPGVAPAVAPVAAVAGVAAVAEKLLRTKVESLAIGGLEVSKIVEKGVMLLKVGEKKCRVTIGGFGLSVTSIEKISDGSVAFNGTVLSVFTGTATVSMTELERVVGELKGLSGKKDIEVSYRNAKNEEKRVTINFEIATS